MKRSAARAAAAGLAAALALCGCTASPSGTPSPEVSVPPSATAVPTAAAWHLPAEEPDATFPVDIWAELDHATTLAEAATLADQLGITAVGYRFSNHNLWGEMHVRGTVDEMLARFIARNQTEPAVIAIQLTFHVTDPTDPWTYPRIPQISTGRNDDFDPPPPAVG
jgi:hypothetical protein